MRQVHQEMGDVLRRLERCLILAGTPRASRGMPSEDAPGTEGDGIGPRDTPDERLLQGAELGEFALHLHSFLLLLDFSSPAYPAKATEAVHHEVQDLLHQGQITVSQQRALLSSLMQRHTALAKFLR